MAERPPPDALKPELKSCPFCGAPRSNPAAQIDVIVSEDDLWSALCFGCFSYGPQEDTRAEAIAAWNRRAGETP
jgi:Lar family restriction alleviation protein